jgi:hypothetical protein
MATLKNLHVRVMISSEEFETRHRDRRPARPVVCCRARGGGVVSNRAACFGVFPALAENERENI